MRAAEVGQQDPRRVLIIGLKASSGSRLVAWHASNYVGQGPYSVNALNQSLLIIILVFITLVIIIIKLAHY